ncbi:hypothetical protein DL769_002545 [Monosporascus sp. CRB-8-3]|nr:hypothetical protein DL769_002545 [Monosporascus sp. CRB-8-3]
MDADLKSTGNRLNVKAFDIAGASVVGANTTLSGNGALCLSIPTGNPYTEPRPDPPKANPDSTCATYLIQNGDTCASLAKKYSVTVDDLDSV